MEGPCSLEEHSQMDGCSSLFLRYGLGLLLGLVYLNAGCTQDVSSFLVLENDSIRLHFDDEFGTLAAIDNKLTGESYTVERDDFEVEIEEHEYIRGRAFPKVRELALGRRDLNLRAVHASQNKLNLEFGDETYTLWVDYVLHPEEAFYEKHLRLTSELKFIWRHALISALRTGNDQLQWVPYAHLKNKTYFGRTASGGLMVGVQVPFDRSSLADGEVHLAYAPSLQVVSGEMAESEPIYVGIYQRQAQEEALPDIPLPSESSAMVAVTSAILGPPRHGLVPLSWGRCSEMNDLISEADLQAGMRAIDTLTECGIEWVCDGEPWMGEAEKVESLKGWQKYEPSPLVADVLKYARQKGLKMMFWPTLNSSNPWPAAGKRPGRPLRPDRPEWLMFPLGQAVTSTTFSGCLFTQFVKGNCLAMQPFQNWLIRTQGEGLDTGYFDGWVVDGDFFGGGGAVEPANCPSANHDHLPGDSNYSCQRALNRVARMTRERYPKLFMVYGRPPRDLGVWSNHDVDACFSLDDFSEVPGLSGSLAPPPSLEPPRQVRPSPLATKLEGLGPRPLNVRLGDRIRTWSRLRVQRHFFPHYLDLPQVVLPPLRMRKDGNWSSQGLEYILLSALAASPNQLYCLPLRSGIPDRDKQTLHRWLEWGRANIKYLRVRKDLKNWPAAGRVDGFAHVIEDQGFIFLFNPNAQELSERFSLDTSIGLTRGERYRVTQVHPSGSTRRQLRLGDEVDWKVPGHTAVLLDIVPD